MSDDSAFVKILQGSALVLLGTVVDMGFSFSTRILTARWLSPGEYGELVLGITFLNLVSLVANLGLQEGIARNIPSEDDPSKVFSTGIIVAFFASVLLSVILLIVSRPIVVRFFGDNYVPIVRIFLIAVPFQVLLWIVVSGFRGLGITRFPVIYQNVFLRVSIFVLLAVGISLGYGSVGAAAGWAGGTALAAVLGTATLFRVTSLGKLSQSIDYLRGYAPTLIKFSVPLMLANSAWRLIQEADNIFIGFYLDSTFLGRYDAGFTVARVILIALWSFSFLFLPIFTEFYEDGQYDKMRLFYSQTTKWITVFILPVYLLIVSFSGDILSIVYGSEYVQASQVLVVISTAFFVHVCFGMNRTALTSIGETRLVFLYTTSALIANIILNFVLIPIFSVVGAAAASFGSYVTMNIALNYKLWSEFEVHPLSKTTIYSAATSAIAFAIVFRVVGALNIEPIYTIAAVGIIHYLMHLVLFVKLGMDERDRRLLSLADGKLPVDLSRFID